MTTQQRFLLALAGLFWCAGLAAQEGLLDDEFGGGSGLLTPSAGSGFIAQSSLAVALDQQGRLLVAGIGLRANNRYQCVVYRLVDDQLDTSFAPPNGIRAIDIGDAAFPNPFCQAILELPDGRIAVAGGAANSALTDFTAMVLVLTQNGAFDANFSGNGVFVGGSEIPAVAGPDLNTAVDALLLDSEGRLLLLGDITNDAQSTSTGLMLRMDSVDGSVDTTFGNTPEVPGAMQLRAADPPVAAVTSVADMVLEASGKVLILGHSGGQLVLFRLNQDGAPDADFGAGMTSQGGNGRGFVPNGQFAYDLLIDTSQRWLLSTSQGGGQTGVLRVLPSGQVDLNYGSGGFAALPAPTAAGEFSSPRFALQNDGKLVLTGRFFVATAFQAQHGLEDLYALRMRANGTIDTAYGYSGGHSRFRFADPLGGSSDTSAENGLAIILDQAGKPVIVGQRINANGTQGVAIITRLTRAPAPPDPLFRNGFD